MNNHLTDEQLVAYHYEYADDRASLARHLASCESCRAGYAELLAVLAAVDRSPVPERGEGYGAEVWLRLRPRLPERAPSPWAWIFTPQRLVLTGAMAALVLVAFFAGRFSPRPVSQPAAVIASETRERVLRADVGNHLERSERVLIELANGRTNGRVDISAEQRWADDLVFANRLYRQTATQSGDAALASVLDELERTLLEIARTPDNITSNELGRLRRRIRARDILFKLRIVAAQLRQQEQQAAAHQRQTF